MNFVELVNDDKEAATEVLKELLQDKVFDYLDNYQMEEGVVPGSVKKDSKDRIISVKTVSDQAATTMKHVVNPTDGEKKAAKDIKPGIAGFRDRIAMLKSAQAAGRLKEDVQFSEEDLADEENKSGK